MPPSEQHSPFEKPTARQTVGALVLFAGVAILSLILLDMSAALPLNMPRSWYAFRPIWGGLGLGLFACGWYLQRRGPVDVAGWNPGPPGRRFRQLIVYSRAECHLCDEAKAVLHKYLDYLPEIEEIDIDTRPELQEHFGTSIPVVEFDGEVRFRGHVDEVLLRRLIEGSAPVTG